MNILALLRWLFWLLTAALAVAAVDRARSGARNDVGLSDAILSTSATRRTNIPADSLVELANRIVDADPFRLSRRPSPIAFGAAPENMTPAPPKPPKPPLALSGTIGGPPWAAILDGVPGYDRSVTVRPGDTLAGLSIRSVTRDRIVVVGFDTTWRLTVRHPWR